MKKILVFTLLLLTSFNLYAQALNKDGSVVTGVLTAGFDPFASFSAEPVLPFPTSLLLMTTTDLTIDAPLGGGDPNDFTNPLVALNSLDGFSTTEKWVTSFSMGDAGAFDNAVPGEIDPASVIPGLSVRVFKVTTSQFLFVTGVEKELMPGVDYFATSAPGGKVAIIPLQPLDQYADYMAVLTNDIRDTRGNDATPDRTYYFGQSDTPWFDANGSTHPFFDDESAADLELVRQVVNSMETAAAAAGVVREDIVTSWTVHTQSIMPVLGALRAIAQPAPYQMIRTPMDTTAVGGMGLADIYIGIITVPYYGGIPSTELPVAPLTDFWKATPGAYLPPFDQLGLDPTSTNLTIANRFPVLTGMQTIPVLMTVPNANSGQTKPEGGWPVSLFFHGLTRNRTDMLALADSLAVAGQVVIAIDQPLHGIVPEIDPQLAPFYVGNTPFAGAANERTFDADLWNNDTGALGPDGKTDPSGRSAINLVNLQATRDNIRQGQADYGVLAMTIPTISIDGDMIPDLNPFGQSVVGHSLGGFVALPFAAIEPLVSQVYLNAGGGGFMRSLNGGEFGPAFIQPTLYAFAGIEPGTAEFEQYMMIAQTLFESGDSINYAKLAASSLNIVHNQVVGDTVVPNGFATAPLAGSEALNRILGLPSYDSTQLNPEGVSGVARFLPPAIHQSLLSAVEPAVTVEMQGQMASFLGSGGTYINVGNPDLLVRLPQAPAAVKPVQGNGKGKSKLKQLPPRTKPENKIRH